MIKMVKAGQHAIDILKRRKSLLYEKKKGSKMMVKSGQVRVEKKGKKR